jgi:hypothetical protein
LKKIKGYHVVAITAASQSFLAHFGLSINATFNNISILSWQMQLKNQEKMTDLPLVVGKHII